MVSLSGGMSVAITSVPQASASSGGRVLPSLTDAVIHAARHQIDGRVREAEEPDDVLCRGGGDGHDSPRLRGHMSIHSFEVTGEDRVTARIECWHLPELLLQPE